MLDAIRKLWSPVEVCATLPSPPDEVFAVLADPTTYPDWLVGAQRIRAVDPQFPAPGSEFKHSVGPGDAATVDDKTEAVEADPPHRLSLEVHAGPFTGRVDFLIEADPDGSLLRFREVPMGVFAVLTPLLRPSLHARNSESLRRLEQLLTAIDPGVDVTEPTGDSGTARR